MNGETPSGIDQETAFGNIGSVESRYHPVKPADGSVAVLDRDQEDPFLEDKRELKQQLSKIEALLAEAMRCEEAQQVIDELGQREKIALRDYEIDQQIRANAVKIEGLKQKHTFTRNETKLAIGEIEKDSSQLVREINQNRLDDERVKEAENVINQASVDDMKDRDSRQRLISHYQLEIERLEGLIYK